MVTHLRVKVPCLKVEAIDNAETDSNENHLSRRVGGCELEGRAVIAGAKRLKGDLSTNVTVNKQETKWHTVLAGLLLLLRLPPREGGMPPFYSRALISSHDCRLSILSAKLWCQGCLQKASSSSVNTPRKSRVVGQESPMCSLASCECYNEIQRADCLIRRRVKRECRRLNPRVESAAARSQLNLSASNSSSSRDFRKLARSIVRLAVSCCKFCRASENPILHAQIRQDASLATKKQSTQIKSRMAGVLGRRVASSFLSACCQGADSLQKPLLPQALSRYLICIFRVILNFYHCKALLDELKG